MSYNSKTAFKARVSVQNYKHPGISNLIVKTAAERKVLEKKTEDKSDANRSTVLHVQTVEFQEHSQDKPYYCVPNRNFSAEKYSSIGVPKISKQINLEKESVCPKGYNIISCPTLLVTSEDRRKTINTGFHTSVIKLKTDPNIHFGTSKNITGRRHQPSSKPIVNFLDSHWIAPFKGSNVFDDVKSHIGVCQPTINSQSSGYNNKYKQKFKPAEIQKNSNRQKFETGEGIEHQSQADRNYVPKLFGNVQKAERESDINEHCGNLSGRKKFGPLLRCNNKPANNVKVILEELKRKIRYKELYVNQSKKKSMQKKQAEEEIRKNSELTEMRVDSDAAIKDIEESIEYHFKKGNLPESLQFRQKLNKTKREIRDQAKVCEEFYKEKLEKEFNISETKLDINKKSYEY